MPVIDLSRIIQVAFNWTVALLLFSGVLAVETFVASWVIDRIVDSATSDSVLSTIAGGLSLLPNNFWILIQVYITVWVAFAAIERFIWLIRVATWKATG